jgi:hypothetical protein
MFKKKKYFPWALKLKTQARPLIGTDLYITDKQIISCCHIRNVYL